MLFIYPYIINFPITIVKLDSIFIFTLQLNIYFILIFDFLALVDILFQWKISKKYYQNGHYRNYNLYLKYEVLRIMES